MQNDEREYSVTSLEQQNHLFKSKQLNSIVIILVFDENND